MDDDLSNLIGRTRLARAPMASSSPTTSIPDAPSTDPSARAIDPPGPPTVEFAPSAVTANPAATDEERILLYVLRLVDRAGDLQPLSPVERAFVEGARVTFDRLAKSCKAMLDRKAWQSLAPIADPRQPPTAGLPRGVEPGIGPETPPSKPRGSSRTPKSFDV